jgi:hypothetical protein
MRASQGEASAVSSDKRFLSIGYAIHTSGAPDDSPPIERHAVHFINTSRAPHHFAKMFSINVLSIFADVCIPCTSREHVCGSYPGFPFP